METSNVGAKDSPSHTSKNSPLELKPAPSCVAPNGSTHEKTVVHTKGIRIIAARRNVKRQKLFSRWDRVPARYAQCERIVTHAYAEFSCVELPQEEVSERQKQMLFEGDPG